MNGRGVKDEVLKVLRSAGVVVVVAWLALNLTIGCSGDKSTGSNGSQKEISFQITGERTVQIWNQLEITVKVTTKSGEKAQLTPIGFPSYSTFSVKSDGTGVIEFCPVDEQMGNHKFTIVANTSKASDSTTIDIAAVDQDNLRKALIPMALGNRWIYQSIKSRQILDTVLIKTKTPGSITTTWDGQLYPIAALGSGALVCNDVSVSSAKNGLQFLVPYVVPVPLEAVSETECYSVNLTRTIEWRVEPVTVPAGTFIGYFAYTASAQTECGSGGSDAIQEEILIKPGVGILKITQIKSSDCSNPCSSKWELAGWKLN